MVLDRPRFRRQSIRLKGYDYSLTGGYFVTICTHGRAMLFGDARDGAMATNDAGEIVKWAWLGLPERFPGIAVDQMVVMPNHIHGVLFLGDADAVMPDESAAPNLALAVRAFKSLSARRVNALLDRHGQPLWQRNYYDRIIRNEAELDRIRKYIVDNPANWDMDEENVNRR